jgi:hypothetical protein
MDYNPLGRVALLDRFSKQPAPIYPNKANPLAAAVTRHVCWVGSVSTLILKHLV